MGEKLQSVKGMKDLLPGDIGVWHKVEQVLREVAWSYGYQEIRTPILEKTELFRQSIGDQTDIVEKEMYTFTDQGGDDLALRPEATASTVRAGNQHGLFYNQRQRLWYMGPMFRRERPQKGRFRQFHQFGIEAFGWPGPNIDAEVIQVCAKIWKQLGLDGIRLQINTVGSPKIRAKYRTALQEYFQQYEMQLDPDSLRRLENNPMRILDSKVPATMDLVAGAPGIEEFLDDTTRNHFDGLCEFLGRYNIKYEINPRLVRGLDYYTSTVFEWVSGDLGAQNAVCAGGRYDELVEMRGGHPTSAVGFALGLERLVDLVRDQKSDADAADGLNIYVISHDADSERAIEVSEKLRDADFRVTSHFSVGTIEKSIKRINRKNMANVCISVESSGEMRVLLAGDKWKGFLDSISLVDWCDKNLKSTCST